MADCPLRLAVIIGSTREGRFAPTVAAWFVRQVRQRGDMTLDVIDLAEVSLPVVCLTQPTPQIKAFTSRTGEADAFVVVTPEYNHGYPASLKLAIDYPYEEWQAKPAAFVCYGA